ncbi:TPR repeat-containing thioredoxin TDX-like isoform X2 [Papaver somniferum]|uniref:TPR repeat-containing thioredoxin TDX-like isoform X2 n=1 Tax=Papaver somniferum TaxID=3469 RepID=UPI000E703837|nr:TPR repeat-containing thioredoxin TDX-like isoform X2 [Papaver somniferum]
MEPEKIEDLKKFVDQCKINPSILNDPNLAFFTTYLQSLGARIPVKTEDVTMEDDIVESDIEFDETGVAVNPDNDDPPQKMGDTSVEVTEENLEAAQISKSKAMDAISEGKLDEAVEYLTEAILLNPCSAILYASRASVFVKMNKPKAAIRDADAALEINPNSAKGNKYRGMARAMLGQWEDAAKDLHVASSLDFDEEIGLMLKKVTPNARKIEDHRRKYERLRKERELRKAERPRPPQKKTSDAVSALNEGHVLSVHSKTESDTKFTAASSLSRLVILYFTAAWCGPCRFMSPLYQSLAEKHPKIVFVKVDIDEARDVAAHWSISSVPTFFFIKNGKEIDRVVGADKAGLETKIAQHGG